MDKEEDKNKEEDKEQEQEEKVEMIIRQTCYTREEAIEKLKENNYDEILTIKSYFGIKEKKQQTIKSINQEMYKQMRLHLVTTIQPTII